MRRASPSACVPVRRAHHGGRAGAVALLAFLVLVLAGPPDCGGVDARRIALCRRAVPALAPTATGVEILHAGRGVTPGSVRVDYRLAGRPDGLSKARWIACGFGPGGELASVTTESGPVSGASVYLLKHYFLDTPEAAEADPSPK